VEKQLIPFGGLKLSFCRTRNSCRLRSGKTTNPLRGIETRFCAGCCPYEGRCCVEKQLIPLGGWQLVA